MRPLAAFAALAAIALILFSLPAGAANKPDCNSKEMHLAEVARVHPKAINTDLNGPHEEIFLANLSQLAGKDLTGLDTILTRNPGFRTTLIALFDRGGVHGGY